MKKYKVYDLYDGKDVLGYADNMCEIKKIAQEEYEETDGECAIYYAELNTETNKYKFSEAKLLKTL